MLTPLRYYDLERYLFEDVPKNFRANGRLSAFEFFSIVIWKANRVKSTIAKRLLSKRLHRRESLEEIVGRLSSQLYAAASERERLRLLMVEWGFRLPMASSILSVLWPESFTVYDVRACEQLQAHQHLANLTKFDRIWDGYDAFVADVSRIGARESLSLRDTDRHLWGRSAKEQLERDLAVRFGLAR